MKDCIERIETYGTQLMSEEWPDNDKVAHDPKHVDHVRYRALHIDEQEGLTELEMVEAAVLLHDIALSSVIDHRKHAEAGAELAATFLCQEQRFSDKQIAEIADAIRYHSSTTGRGQLGAFARDTDMQNLFGAVGLVRALTSTSTKPSIARRRQKEKPGAYLRRISRNGLLRDSELGTTSSPR